MESIHRVFKIGTVLVDRDCKIKIISNSEILILGGEFGSGYEEGMVVNGVYDARTGWGASWQIHEVSTVVNLMEKYGEL